MSYKSKILFSLLSVTSFISAAPSSAVDRLINETGTAAAVGINNRILLKINGKHISILDVVKRMDLIFYRQYPSLASSPGARFQFYMTNWKASLRAVIDDQLILADAEEKKVEVTDGDVREELESLFGPDVVLNIDKMGLSYEDTWNLLRDELKVRQMNNMMVRAKALNDVGPKSVRQYYEEYLKSHPPEEVWIYRIGSIRGADKEQVASLADHVHRLAGQGTSLEAIFASLKEEAVFLSLSEEYERKEQELSEVYKKALSQLADGEVSLPSLQPSKKGDEWTARLFLLKEHRLVTPPSFDAIKGEIQSQLTQKSIARHAEIYLNKLREHYGITDAYISQMIPEHFEPFTIR